MVRDLQGLFPTPVPSVRMQRHLKDRHALMHKWHGIAKTDYNERPTWMRRVDYFLDDIEGCIYRMGYNALDHSRRADWRREAA